MTRGPRTAPRRPPNSAAAKLVHRPTVSMWQPLPFILVVPFCRTLSSKTDREGPAPYTVVWLRHVLSPDRSSSKS